MDTNTHKSVAIDIQTYNILTRMAEEECRTVGMQIKWLIKNSGTHIDTTPVVEDTPPPIKMKPKPSFTRIISVGSSADMLVRFYQTEASMSAKDFNDLPVEDPAKLLYAMATRGDLKRIGNVAPFYYQITPQGRVRAEKIIKVRREENGS
jgi:hypothetical protein